MITQEIKEIYRCSHCNKLYLKKHACIKHEVICKLNPNNRPKCFDGCDYLQKRNLLVNDSYGHIRTFSTFYCPQTELFMHTPVSEAKGKPIKKRDGSETKVMPRECKLYSVTTNVNKRPF